MPKLLFVLPTGFNQPGPFQDAVDSVGGTSLFPALGQVEPEPGRPVAGVFPQPDDPPGKGLGGPAWRTAGPPRTIRQTLWIPPRFQIPFPPLVKGLWPYRIPPANLGYRPTPFVLPNPLQPPPNPRILSLTRHG